jgi:membrane protein required for colicin V production
VIGTFLVALIVLHLLTMWIGDLVVDSRVGPLDRTLGFVFGAARGILISVVAAVFANFLIGAQDPMLKDSKSFPPLLSAGDYLIGLLPPDLEEQFRDFLERGGQNPEEGPAEPTDPDAPADDTSLPPADISSSEPAPSA